METAPIVNKPNAPLVWHDTEGRDLCGPCATMVEERSPDSIEGADVFVNWRDYDYRCFICDERFALEDEDEG